MPPRRRVFDQQYGAAKTEQSKGGAKLPPPQQGPPVPLSLHGTPDPNTLPGQGGSQVPPELEEMLQQLLAQMGMGGGRG